MDNICSIPLSPLRPPDRLVWAATKQGIFTVRSAYYLEKQRKEQEEWESSNGGINRLFWKSLWAMNVPGVFKNFMWKVSLNLLPTKDNLYRKKIAQDPLCPICLRERETTGHILWGCRSSQAVWQESSRKIQKISLAEDDGMALLQALHEKLEEHDFIHVILVAQLIWLRINSFIFDGLFYPPSLLVQQACDSREAFESANVPRVMLASQLSPVTIQWTKPPFGSLNYNLDASLDSSGKQMGVGIVVRVESGAFKTALISTEPYICDSEVVEAIAVWRAFLFGEELGGHRSIFEGDSLNVVKAINSSEVCCRPCGNMVEALKERLLQHPDWTVSFARREANQVAHCLAKYALEVHHEMVWKEGCPPFLQAIVNDEFL